MTPWRRIYSGGTHSSAADKCHGGSASPEGFPVKARNLTFLIALGTSLAVHLTAIPVSVRVRTGGWTIADAARPRDTGEMKVVWEEWPEPEAAPVVKPDADDEQPSEPEGDPDKHADDPAMSDHAAEVPPAPEKPEPKKLTEFPIGDPNGTGYASNDSPGEREASAKKAESDQAFLSRDPSGTGEPSDKPSMTLVQGDSGRGGTPGAPAPSDRPPQPVQAPAGQPKPIGTTLELPDAKAIQKRVLEWAARITATDQRAASASPAQSDHTSLTAPRPSAASAGRRQGIREELPSAEGGLQIDRGADTAARRTPKVAEAPVKDPGKLPTLANAPTADSLVLSEQPGVAPRPAAVVVPPAGVTEEGMDPTARRTPTIVAKQTGTGDGRAPGASSPAADPAPMSDTDSDPFSTLGSAEFREGRVTVRAGRKIKAVRPKLTLAGKVDVFSMQGARVVLHVATDASGKVTGVEVAKSSGSTAIDQPCRRAMYDWWFEPKKGREGTPLPDHFQFTIVWH